MLRVTMRKPIVIDDELTMYDIYDDGRVQNRYTKEFLKTYRNSSGYEGVSMKSNKYKGKYYRESIHRLVAENFVENINNEKTVNHIDGDKDNNKSENLEWISQKENNLHAYRTGIRKPNDPDKVPFTKYTKDQVRRACEMIAEDKVCMFDIEKETGIPVKTLYDIRRHRTWKSISKDYVFPEYHQVYTPGSDYHLINEIKKLVRSGLKNQEIYDTLGIERTKKLSKIMTDHRMVINRKKGKKKMKKSNDYRNKLVVEFRV